MFTEIFLPNLSSLSSPDDFNCAKWEDIRDCPIPRTFWISATESFSLRNIRKILTRVGSASNLSHFSIDVMGF